MSTIIFDCERMKYEHTGIYHYCLQLGKQLLQHKTRNRLVMYTPPKSAGMFEAPVLIQHPIHKLVLPSLEDCRIWHSTYQHSDYIPSAKNAVKVVLTVHDLNFIHDEHLPDHKKERYLKNLQKRINRADAIVCISEYGKKDLQTFCHTGRKPVHVIYNGSNALPAPELGPRSYRPRRPFLFSIGAMRRKKNFHALLPLIKQNYLDLVIAGSQEDREYLRDVEKAAKLQGVHENLHMIGQVSETEKSWYYHNCHAFLFPSLAEGFGLPLVEAMSAGKPVFVAGRTALPEIGSTAAFYFNDFSVEEMQSSFLQGMQQYEKNNMSEQIRKRAGDFSWEKAAAQYMNVYHSLL